MAAPGARHVIGVVNANRWIPGPVVQPVVEPTIMAKLVTWPLTFPPVTHTGLSTLLPRSLTLLFMSSCCSWHRCLYISALHATPYRCRRHQASIVGFRRHLDQEASVEPKPLAG